MPKPIALLVILMCALGVCLSGCTIAGYTVAKRADLDRQIETARSEAAAKLEGLRKQETSLLAQTIKEHEAREQLAADYLFKGAAVSTTFRPDQLTRPAQIMAQSIQQTALQLPPATAGAQAATFKALQTELDETKVSTEALKVQYERELGIARTEGETKAKALTELKAKADAIEAEKVSVLTKANQTEVALQAAKDKVQDKDVADAKRSAEEAQHNERIRMWLIGVLLVAAAACGIGAAFVPIPQLKTKLVIGAAICGGAALAIPFIQPWMVMVAIVICLLPVVGWAIKSYRDEHADATDTYRALNEIKTKATDTFKQEVAPLLKQWHTDPNTSKRIEQRLKAVGDV